MTTAANYPVADAVGLPECTLPGSVLSQLPTSVAPAPWAVTADVVTWLHEVEDEALEAFPAPIRPDRIAMVAWALVRYHDTPVGPYSELAATLIPDGGDGYGHIPFIVVDSPASVVGGRVNWLLPKALAAFDWSGDGRSVSIAAGQPATPAWSVAVSYAVDGEPAEVEIPNNVRQVGADGRAHRFHGVVRGELSSATVTVDAHAEGLLASLIRAGTFAGSSLTTDDFTVGPLLAG